ncbi:hypothetical protein HDZ31DRAFT_36651 [Schizophyllum fasciatum]
MGQYHHAFLIAKVRPHGGSTPRYRCLGGIWNSWCYGSLPVKGAHRMITLLRQPSNAQIVREELRSIEGKYGATGEDEPRIPRVPCPYTLFLLLMSFNVDYDDNSLSLSGRYFSMGSYKHTCDAGMGCWGNDDGLTIIDITDPLNPRYCFLPGHSTPIRSPKMLPLSVEKYLGAYYKKEAKESAQWKHCEALFALMKGIPLISEHDVAQVWPSEARHQEGGREEPTEAGEEAAEQLMKKGTDEAASGAGEALEIPSLASLTLGPSIQQALETGDTEGIVPILMQSDKFTKVMDTVRATEGPFPDISIPVLAKILEFGPSTINLTDIQLSGEQLVKVLPRDKPLDVVDLSGNTALTEDGLVAILGAKLSIRRLVIVRTGVENDDLIKLLNNPALFANIEELIHPLLYSWITAPLYPVPFTFYFASHSAKTYEFTGAVGIPLLSIRQLAQNLPMLVDCAVKDWLTFGRGDSCFAAAMTAGVLPEGKAWGERSVWCTPAPSPEPEIPYAGSWKIVLRPGDLRRHDTSLTILHLENKEGTRTTTVHTLQEFLIKLKHSGYPPPSPEDVAKLESVLQ